MGAWVYCTDFAVAYKATGWLLWFIWFVWFVLFIWLNQRDQMNQSKPDEL